MHTRNFFLVGRQFRRFCSASNSQNPVSRILLTGGPCAGKSTALSTIQQFLINHGFTTYMIPEATTLLQIQGGIKLQLSTLPYFQRMITSLQNNLEESYYDYALNTQHMTNKPVAILIDRGILDGNAYITDKNDFDNILKYALNDTTQTINTNQLINNKYDMILHLETAAKGAREFYAKEAHRNELPDDAVKLDDKILDIYSNHNDRRIVTNISTFEDKLQEIISHVSDKLKIQNVSRKTLRFIVEMIDNNYSITHIVQELQNYTNENIIVSYVIKYFLSDEFLSVNNGYAFIRETNTLNIDSVVSIDEQIQNIYNKSLEDSISYPSSLYMSIQRDDTIDIPSKASSAWLGASHYMLVQCSEEFGQIINESKKLTKTRYNELRFYKRDVRKQRVEKVKIFFHYKQQFYALDVFTKPESHKNSMWLKVYRTPGNKYKSSETDKDNVDVPSCIKIMENVTTDPHFSSYSYSKD